MLLNALLICASCGLVGASVALLAVIVVEELLERWEIRRMARRWAKEE